MQSDLPTVHTVKFAHLKKRSAQQAVIHTAAEQILWCCQADYGGFQQYVEWTNSSNASSVDQFYKDPDLQVRYTILVSMRITSQGPA